MRFRQCTASAFLLIFGLIQGSAQSPTSAAAGAARPAYLDDPKFQAAWKEARSIRSYETTFQAAAYKKANKIAGGQCLECLQGMYRAQIASHDFKDAAATSNDMLALMTTPATKSNALRMKADAMLLQAGDKPKPAQLEAVDAVLREAIELYPRNAGAQFDEGKVLTRLGRLDEAKSHFTDCVNCVSQRDPARVRAQHFAENPSLSLQKMAPAFEVTALDGSKFNLDNMGGRVVLIDFWATWCGPCNEELPQVKQIAKDFAGQPLVIISVSWDADAEKWKSFINKNEMTWVQYRDADHALSKLFSVESIPHYFTIDSDGVLTAEMLGSGHDVESKLKKLIARARDSQTRTVASIRP